VRSVYNGRTYGIPITLDTINSFYNENFTPAEARQFVEAMRVKNPNPQNFEEQALALIGPGLYEAFIRGYTLKQWETDPKDLPASVARRLPVRFNYDNTYWQDTWSGIPVGGYTPIFERMLDHKNIQVFLNTDWFDVAGQVKDKLVIYTGAIDRYYDYCYGRLAWRTLDFEFQTFDTGDYQGIAAINYPDATVPYTRSIEHRHFHPERRYDPDRTVVNFEYSRAAQPGDVEYYPVNRPADRRCFEQYRERADQEANVIFGGRLGEYMYYDMHQVIGSALSAYQKKVKIRLTKQTN